MLFLDYYRPADPPTPGPRELRRMAVDAVRDGLPLTLVARLFDLDPVELERLVAEREERRRLRAEAIMAGRRAAARRRAALACATSRPDDHGPATGTRMAADMDAELQGAGAC